MLEIIRQRLASRTYRAAVLLTIMTTIEININVIGQFVPEKYRPLLLAVWPFVMAYYREKTDSPLSAK